jgi:hypothetical protein
MESEFSRLTVEHIEALRKRVSDLETLEAGAATYPAGTTFNLNRIFLFPQSSAAPYQYEKTDSGLAAALALASVGEIVMIHGPATFTSAITIPGGVILVGVGRPKIIIANSVYLGVDSAIFNLDASATANDANPLYGVVGPLSDTAYIYYCDISAIQSGAGNAYAIGATRGGDIVVRHSTLYGSSVSGSGYCGRASSGFIYSRHNDYIGSTDRWVLG